MVQSPVAPMAVGDLLVNANLLTPQQMADAIRARIRTGSRLESIVIAAGMVRRHDVYRVLAEAWDLLYLDALEEEDFDDDLVAGLDPAQLVDEGWFPVRHIGGNRVLVATAEAPTDTRRAHVAGILKADVVFAAATGLDIDTAVVRAFRGQVLDEACLGLWRRDEDRSARTVLNGRQKVLLAIGLVLLLAGLVFATRWTIVVISAAVGLAFLVSVTFKFVMCLTGVRYEGLQRVTKEDVDALKDTDLPPYTVLVPVFRESEVVKDLVANLGALDYPTSKLQILLLLEEDDRETREAALASNPPETITFVTVPSGSPQTKPKACNVGLFLARGDYLVIYDAEDRPDPDQLKRAVVAFRRGDRSLVCVQAALNYFNADENALTRMFTLEYSFWFDYMLPGLEAWRMPIPLGGTSNHFRTNALKVLGGWDPFNVTEDADLGIRAAALGRTVGVIESTTFEEANRAYGNFLRQRSRWIKGYMQTTLVHLRHPVKLFRQTGPRAAFGFVMLVGGTPVSFLCVPPLYALFLVSLLVPPDALAPYFPGWVMWMSLLNLLLGNALMIYVSMMGAFKRRRYKLVAWALLNPAYWLMHSIAAYKGLWQLITKPHYWEKTAHGLSTVDANDPAPGSAPQTADHPVRT
ncbi:glycosyltransferase [Actinoplanes friuliensis]|nr:glycosyltransferase [Actinoplanes friuliensis]